MHSEIFHLYTTIQRKVLRRNSYSTISFFAVKLVWNYGGNSWKRPVTEFSFGKVQLATSLQPATLLNIISFPGIFIGFWPYLQNNFFAEYFLVATIVDKIAKIRNVWFFNFYDNWHI